MGTGNNITNNDVGIYLKDVRYLENVGMNNQVFNNNIIDNDFQVHVDPISDIVLWDNSTIGNYWNDYTGTDNNDDGIGDTPYVIYENNKDNFPLMEPTIIPEFPSWTILPIIITTTLVVMIVKKKLSKKGLK